MLGWVLTGSKKSHNTQAWVLFPYVRKLYGDFHMKNALVYLFVILTTMVSTAAFAVNEEGSGIVESVANDWPGFMQWLLSIWTF